MMLGASGVLLGTRFYASLECDGAEEAKKRICAASSGNSVRGIVFDLSRNNVWPAPFNGRCLINDHARRWTGREVELLQNIAAVAADYAAARAAGNFDIAAVIARRGRRADPRYSPGRRNRRQDRHRGRPASGRQAQFVGGVDRTHLHSIERAKNMWPDRRIVDLFKTEFPILLAPMAGVMDQELAIAAAQGGALASLPCAMITADKAREQVNIFRQRVSAPINLNYFCHTPVDADPAREAGWRKQLTPYFEELGLDPAASVSTPPTARRSTKRCALWSRS